MGQEVKFCLGLATTSLGVWSKEATFYPHFRRFPHYSPLHRSHIEGHRYLLDNNQVDRKERDKLHGKMVEHPKTEGKIDEGRNYC
jgi:hypothetical protein